MARMKRILTYARRSFLGSYFGGTYGSASSRRLREVTWGGGINGTHSLILCRSCAKKFMAEHNQHVDRSIYERYKTHHGSIGPWDIARSRLVGEFEKLKCQKCGKRNEK